MQTQISPLSRVLPISLLAIVTVAVIIANYFGQIYAALTSDFANLLITTPLLFTSIALSIRDKGRGDLGKAWVCFTAVVILWFVAERIWMVYDLTDGVDPWPSEADYFWLAGYPVYFAFTFFYLKPFRNSISKTLMFSASTVTVLAAGFLASSIFEENSFSFETMLGMAYPVLDAISITPIIIGLVLFLRGQTSFLWSCLFIGMLCFVVADYGFLFLSLDQEYYSGHVIDIPYLWAYIFFLFGTNDYTNIFKIRSKDNRFNN
ncbi:MAG: hypothetical protein QXW37_05145 [Candidatus Nitrosotenuis sp.]